MHIPKEREIQPSEWLDVPNFEDTPQDTKSILKVIRQTFNLRTDVVKLFNEVKISGHFNEIIRLKTHIKNLKNIKVQFEVTFIGDDFPCVFFYHQGRILPQLLIKEINQCNLREVDICRFGFNSKHKTIQLKTAIIIIYGTIIRSILGNKINRKITIEEGSKHIEQKLSNYPIEKQLILRRILKILSHSIIHYNIHETIENFINENPVLKEKSGIDSDDKSFIEIETEFYKKSILKLSEAINKSIDVGLFREYEKDSSTSICEHHSLLNNKKLLSKLHGTSLSAAGNRKKAEKQNQIKNFILSHILTEQNKHRFKNKSTAADQLAQELGAALEELIKSQKANPESPIKPENFPRKIERLISENQDLHAYLIRKVEKCSDS